MPSFLECSICVLRLDTQSRRPVFCVTCGNTACSSCLVKLDACPFCDKKPLRTAVNRTLDDMVRAPAVTAVQISDIAVGKRLGEGSTAVVYEATYQRAKVAFKRYKVSVDSANNNIAKTIRGELNAIASLSHPSIVQTFGAVWEDDRLVGILQELMSSTLEEYIREHPGTSVSHRLHLLSGAALGLAFVHTCNIVHRDVKPANFLVDKYRKVKLGDFGTARTLMETMSTSTTVGALGTPLFMAPEYAQGAKPQSSIDVFSFGMTMWSVLHSGNDEDVQFCRQPPLALMLQMSQGRRPRIANVPKDVADLIQRCWNGNSNERPCMETICDELRSMAMRREDAADEMKRKQKVFDMQIRVKTLTGKIILIEVNSNDTIATMKQAIESIEGVPLEDQRLIFAGFQLEDKKTVSNYGIKHHSCVHMVLRLQGGKPVITLRSRCMLPSVSVSIKLQCPADSLTSIYPPTTASTANQCLWRDCSVSGDVVTFNGRPYPYLFWEYQSDPQHSRHLALRGQGHTTYTRGSELGDMLDRLLAAAGLGMRSRCDLITFWAPQVETSPFVGVDVLVNDARYCSDTAVLEVQPAPAATLRVFCVFARYATLPAGANASTAASVESTESETVCDFSRRHESEDGLFVEEWGGIILPGDR